MYCTGGFWKTTTVDESKRDINLGMMTEAGELMKQRLAALDILARTKLKDDLGKMDDASVTLMKHGKPHLVTSYIFDYIFVISNYFCIFAARNQRC